MQPITILGAGISGLSVGLLLLRQGIDNIIIEGSDDNSLKLNETLTPYALKSFKKLGLSIPKELFSIPEMVYLSPDAANALHIYLYSTKQFYTVNKAKLEAFLKTKYLQAGGRILFRHILKAVDKKDNTFYLNCENGKIFLANILFNCLGKLQNFPVLATYKKLEAPLDTRISIFSHYLVQHELEQNKNYIIPLDKSFFYILPMSKEAISIGYTSYARKNEGQQNLKNIFDKAIMDSSWVRSLVSRAALLFGPISVLNHETCVENYYNKGVFCVGDSLGFKDPFFYDGIYFAIESAFIAVNSFLLFQKENFPHSQVAREYQAKINVLYRRRVKALSEIKGSAIQLSKAALIDPHIPFTIGSTLFNFFTNNREITQ